MQLFIIERKILHKNTFNPNKEQTKFIISWQNVKQFMFIMLQLKLSEGDDFMKEYIKQCII